MTLLDLLDQTSEFVSGVVKKLSAPLVTLLSAEPEIQYVALRNISLIIQKRYVYMCQYFVPHNTVNGVRTKINQTKIDLIYFVFWRSSKSKGVFYFYGTTTTRTLCYAVSCVMSY